MENDEITNEDIDMLSSNDFSPRKLTSYNSNNNCDDPNAYSPADNKDRDSLDDSFFNESDTKTPGEILDEFCMKLEDINTTLPDSVINHYMKKAGFIVNDPKLVKIVSIASQKFISEIVNDVMQHHKLKSKTAALIPAAGASQAASKSKAATGGATGGAAGSSTAAQSSSSTNASNSAPLTLTLEDLSQVLTEYGINVKKPYYFM